MLKLNKSLTNDFLTKQRRFYSKTSNDATKINVDYLKAKLSKYNVPDYYEKSLKNHVNISRFKGRAAVLIPISIREDTNSAYFTLSKRTDLMSSHKGEVCFLGGKRDEVDKNDVETAYREAKEEANVDSSSLTFLAQLCPIISFQQLLVTPVLAYFDKTNYQPVLNSKEVISWFIY
jgi:8-oxo-dGTP pyrophosphatase MutT (NUDIX family)